MVSRSTSPIPEARFATAGRALPGYELRIAAPGWRVGHGSVLLGGTGAVLRIDELGPVLLRPFAALRRDGVQVKILTGDNELVTKKVCHDVAMTITKIVTSRTRFSRWTF